MCSWGSVKKRPSAASRRRGHYIGAALATHGASYPHVPTPRKRQLAPIVPHRRAAAAWLDPPGALPHTGRAHLHYRGLRHYRGEPRYQVTQAGIFCFMRPSIKNTGHCS